MTWRPHYAVLAVLLFAVEVSIALFVRDRFVRPYLGDTLAVVLVYCGLRTVLPLRPPGAAALAFGIAVLIELGQAIHLVELIGLRGNRIAEVVLGTGFEWWDFVAYAAGAALALAGSGLLALNNRHPRAGGIQSPKRRQRNPGSPPARG